MEENLTHIIREFCVEEGQIKIEEITIGHINRTYSITIQDAAHEYPYVLQRINNSIFQDVDGLMKNIAAITEHLRRVIQKENGDPSRETLTVIPTKQGKSYTRCGDGYWRMYRFIVGAHTENSANSKEMFQSVGEAFGHFQRQLADFDASVLTETIPDFHNTPKRFEAFLQALREDRAGRAADLAGEIAFLKDRSAKMDQITGAIARGEIPLRVTHNDTKLNNVMLDNESGKPLCVIDLDTVMPGSMLCDYGDAIRFGASTAAEDEADLTRVNIDLSLFEAFTKGFLQGTAGALSDKEIELLPVGAYMMTLECGMRFLTDYLNGDTYFRIQYPNHNLVRARNQFKLISDMENKWAEMQRIVEFCRKECV